MPAAISQFLSSLPYESALTKVTSPDAAHRELLATRGIQHNGLGMIPESRDACQFWSETKALLIDIAAIEIFHA
jgi:hypothetical protein